MPFEWKGQNPICLYSVVKCGYQKTKFWLQGNELLILRYPNVQRPFLAFSDQNKVKKKNLQGRVASDYQTLISSDLFPGQFVAFYMSSNCKKRSMWLTASFRILDVWVQASEFRFLAQISGIYPSYNFSLGVKKCG